MNNPDTYEGAMTQAETACANRIADLLELRIGKEMTVGISDGQANGAVFDIGRINLADMTTFNSPSHCFRATLELYNRDRAKLQNWIMRLVHSLPVNHAYNRDDALREDTNVAQLRVVPDSSSIGKIVPTEVVPKIGGNAVPTWKCEIVFDVVFIVSEDADVDDTDPETPGGGTDPAPITDNAPPFTRFARLTDYLYEIDFDRTFHDEAQAFYASVFGGIGGCSALRRGNYLGRNYDWTRGNAASFVVRMSADDATGRHASTGMASVGERITDAMAQSGVFGDVFKVIPHMMLDGVNDAGVVAEINVIPRDPSKDPARGGDRNLNALAVVRCVLDNFTTAREAAEYIAAHYFIPDGSADSYHWMIADGDETWIVEDGAAFDGATAMTNYRVGSNPDPFGTGRARMSILESGEGSIDSLMEAVKFTNAYATGWPRPDEFAGVEDAQGRIPHDATERLKAWATAHVTPLLDPVTRKPATRGNGCWQTVHSAIYNIEARTFRVAVQENWDELFDCGITGRSVRLASGGGTSGGYTGGGEPLPEE